jgi:hypothetical protein
LSFKRQREYWKFEKPRLKKPKSKKKKKKKTKKKKKKKKKSMNHIPEEQSGQSKRVGKYMIT